MPRMSSPDGSEVLTIPDSGVQAMKSLGWAVEGESASATTQKPASQEPAEDSGGEEPKRRKPGRPRKNPPPETAGPPEPTEESG